MAINVIKNQPIRFRNSDTISEECDCLGQEFQQLVNNTDQTQYQLSSTNLVSNSDFESNLNGWDIYTAIEIELTALVNESVEGECDGEITVTASGGTGPYTYSIDGGAFGGSANFTGLCSGDHYVTVKDSSGNEGSIVVSVDTNVVCGDYAGSSTDDLLPLNTSHILNCNTDDFL